MNKGMLAIAVVFLSLIALYLLNVLSSFSTGSELDYYLVKETTDAAISDAVDGAYLTTCGLYRIDKEKFIESFLYRFADSVDHNRTYTIGFYDINEVPPKVSIKVDSATVLSFNSVKNKNGNVSHTGNVDFTTSYDAIIESNNKADPALEMTINREDTKNCKLYSDAVKSSK